MLSAHTTKQTMRLLKIDDAEDVPAIVEAHAGAGKLK